LPLAPTIDPDAVPVGSCSESAMASELLVHDGRLGLWVCSSVTQPIENGGLCASAEVSLDGKHRCRLTLILPRSWVETDLESFKRRCLNWILEADRRTNASVW